MTVTIADIQTYLRLPSILEASEQGLITSLIASAEDYIKDVTGKSFSGDSLDSETVVNCNIYNLAVKMLVAHWYDNRGAATEKPVSDLPYTLDCLINTLKLSTNYE